MSGSYELITAPASEPLVVADDVKPHLSLTGISTHDAMLGNMLTRARQYLERALDRGFIDQTWKAYFDDFPNMNGPIQLLRSPLSSVTSVTYLDEDHATQTLATSNYVVDDKSDPGRVVLAPDKTWPATSTNPNAVTVDFVVGYGPAASDVPEDIKQALLDIVAHTFFNRGDMKSFPWSEIPSVENILWSRWTGVI